MNSGTAANPGLGLAAQTTGGITIAELTGELDIASAPALRDQLLSLLRPGSSRLVIDLSKVSFCDASGLAVLVNTARRARLLGGFLRLAAVSPQVGQGLNITGLRRHLANFPTVQAAATGAQPQPAGLPAHTPGPRTGTRGHPRSRPAPVNCAGRSPPCWPVPMHGTMPIPAAGSPRPCARWPAPAMAPTTLPWTRRHDPCCLPSPAIPSPPPRQWPQPQPACGRSSIPHPGSPLSDGADHKPWQQRESHCPGIPRREAATGPPSIA
jgi:anti-sigma B factor antagonist